MKNHLKDESSPYLLQHADNPVDWYPWGKAAFETAQREDKPIFLSIGYSTCHWCHVMAHESFEDKEIAELLNSSFVSVKVDREERPDVDSVYMAVCQAMTGGGGWPMSIFLAPDQTPFFAGTYFPKTSRHGSIGFFELLLAIHDAWQSNRAELLSSAERLLAASKKNDQPAPLPQEHLLELAMKQYKTSFDDVYGGFGAAPKFPAPHNLLFLMQQYKKRGDASALNMAEKALVQMARGGLFDHVGFGFCRYSTDHRFLVPHFEKMLYDNAMLILAYCRAFELTRDELYKSIAEKTASYLLSDMRSPDGAFFSAQDADSDGEEGKYYVFTPDELYGILGEADGKAFCEAYDITAHGNFDGKSIPNLLTSHKAMGSLDRLLPRLRAYRKSRVTLSTDDKILTAWNGLMIAALCSLYRISRNEKYLRSAKETQRFIEADLCAGDTLSVSVCNGKRGAKGFLDDYAAYCFGLLALYDVTLVKSHLDRAAQLAAKATADFFDSEAGGYTLSGRENESLILNRKESYDGAMPSGNSLMAYNLIRLRALMPEVIPETVLKKQFSFLMGESARYPAGYAMFLMALSDEYEPPETVTVVCEADHRADIAETVFHTDSGALLRVCAPSADGYGLLNGETALYVCRGSKCLPPVSISSYIAAANSR